MTDLKRPWIVPPAAEMTYEDYADEDGHHVFVWLDSHTVARPGFAALDDRRVRAGIAASVPVLLSTPAFLWGWESGLVAAGLSALPSWIAGIYGHGSKRGSAWLTPETLTLWKPAAEYGSKILDAARGTTDEHATRHAVITLQRDILDALEVASECEFTIWRMLKFDRPGLLKFAVMQDRDLRRRLVGDRLVEALNLDDRRIDHLRAAAEGIQALVNLSHYANESAVNRRRYEDSVGQPAPPRVIDTEAVDQLTVLYAADAETVAALPQ